MEENFANDDLIVKAVVVVGDTEEEKKSIGIFLCRLLQHTAKVSRNFWSGGSS